MHLPIAPGCGAVPSSQDTSAIETIVNGRAAHASEQPRLLLSDQDSHLLDFPDAPPITRGGFCELYVAVYRPDHLKLAMRRLKADFPTEDMLRRFRREARTWSSFKHANILPFYGTMNISCRIYIVCPWMPTGDLLRFVQTRIGLIQGDKDLSEESVLSIYRDFNETRVVQEIASGLEYLHSIDVVHGDMKAQNVLLDDGGHAQICDFGLTKTLEHAVTSAELKGVGSIRWQSPELLDNVSKSAQSDVYAFGMTIVEVLTGNHPFPHVENNTAVLVRILFRHERPAFQPLSRLGVDFGPLWKLAARCWQTKADERPPMKEVLQQLEPLDSLLASLSIQDPELPNPAFANLVDRHKIAIQPTPNNRLPEAILQSIFLLTHGSYSTAHEAQSFTMTMSAICRHWRIAATTSPALWSQIVFDGLPPFRRQSLQVARSGRVSLTIEVDMDYGPKHTAELIKLLRPHIGRWRSLTMSPGLQAESYRCFFDALRHERAPMLEVLDVVNYGRNHEWKFRPFSIGTPRLIKLTVGSCRLKGNTALFGHLTDLTIMHDDHNTTTHPLTTHDLLAIIAQCAPTIQSIHFNIPNCKLLQSPCPWSLPIFLPNLQRMTLYKAQLPSRPPPCWVLEIYSSIVAPKLRGASSETPHLQDHDASPQHNNTSSAPARYVPRRANLFLHNEAAANWQYIIIKELISLSGLPDCLTWHVSINVNGLVLSASAGTKQDARDAASAMALEVMGYDLEEVPPYE